eukprot:TRINITY_DN66649_c7_g8_i1.p1 TRINITY_DN66649_c7_g8~~TRINITY_DN66649_c7_g8_i1.p1  ORF type:complete len:341 (-),score=21.36 TRINITY_DN66649_c7_g8_i1:313-1290(-)
MQETVAEGLVQERASQRAQRNTLQSRQLSSTSMTKDDAQLVREMQKHAQPPPTPQTSHAMRTDSTVSLNSPFKNRRYRTREEEIYMAQRAAARAAAARKREEERVWKEQQEAELLRKYLATPASERGSTATPLAQTPGTQTQQHYSPFPTPPRQNVPSTSNPTSSSDRKTATPPALFPAVPPLTYPVFQNLHLNQTYPSPSRRTQPEHASVATSPRHTNSEGQTHMAIYRYHHSTLPYATTTRVDKNAVKQQQGVVAPRKPHQSKLASLVFHGRLRAEAEDREEAALAIQRAWRGWVARCSKGHEEWQKRKFDFESWMRTEIDAL